MSGAWMALLLEAISAVESGHNPRVRGAAGELGRFQMTPMVAAQCGGYGQREAERHLRWLERQLVAAGIEPTPRVLALAWNAGAGAVIRGEAPAPARDYAERVDNVMQALRAQQVAKEGRPVVFLIR